MLTWILAYIVCLPYTLGCQRCGYINGYEVYPPNSERLNSLIELGIDRVSESTRGIHDRMLEAQKTHIHSLIRKESGGKVKAQNKRSTAFGMFPILEFDVERGRNKENPVSTLPNGGRVTIYPEQVRNSL